jgi:tetratricopeptide (TPR) repeat protein
MKRRLTQLLAAALVTVAGANGAYAQAKGKKAGKKPAPTAPAAETPAAPPQATDTEGNAAGSTGGGEAGGPAATLEKGLTLYDDEDFFEAAKMFHAVSEDANPAADPFRQKAEFFLGKSLYNLGYYAGSLAYFQRISQAGATHSYYRATLKFLAALAEKLPNDAPLLELIGLYSTEDFPESNKEELSYLLGKNQYNLRNLEAAAALLQLVTPSSEYYLDAKFYEAIVQVSLNDGKAATDALKAMLVYISEAKLKPTYQGEVKDDLDRFENLVNLTMGRVFYTTRQFQTAIKYFDKVETESEFWLEALFGSTWSYFQINGFDKALGHIHTLNSPYFESEFYPESLIVKSVIYFYNCRYDDAAGVEAKFEDTYKPVIEELRKYLERFSEDEQFYTFVAKFRRGKVTLTPRIQRIVSITLSDKALLKQFEQIEQIDKEQKQLKLDKKKWDGDKIAQRLEEDLDIAKTFAIGEAGTQVKTRFQRVQTDLNDLIRQGIKIKFEVAKAQAGEIEEELQRELADAAAPTEPNTAKKGRAVGGIFVDDEHQLWNFDREYWKDELGYYRTPVESKCKGFTAPAEPSASN